MSSNSRRAALCVCAAAVIGDAVGFSVGSTLPQLRRSSASGASLTAKANAQEHLDLVHAAVTRRQVLSAGAFAAGSFPLRVFAAADDEEEEEVGPGGNAGNAFDGTERILAPKGDDPLDSEKFRKRQDLTTFKPWTPEGEIGDLGLPVMGKKSKLADLMGEGATIVMNIKLDDPETISQIPALKTLIGEFKDQGLRAILIPTDQGDYEPDDSATVRIKVGQQFGIRSSKKGPVVVTDKTDIVGKFCLPLYKYLTTNAPNPNAVSRITLNYEKFLLDADGNIMRRYPRQWGADRMEKDVKAVLAGNSLPKEDPKWLFAWEQADKEATRSMYSFRKHYNYYDQQEAGQDWAGTKSEFFNAGSNEPRFKGATTGKPLVITEGD